MGWDFTSWFGYCSEKKACARSKTSSYNSGAYACIIVFGFKVCNNRTGSNDCIMIVFIFQNC